MTGISSSGPLNGPVFREFEIDPSKNGPPLDSPKSLTEFAHKSLRGLIENSRGVLEGAKPFIMGGFMAGVMAVATEAVTFNIFTAPPLIASGLYTVIVGAMDELNRQERGGGATVTIEGVTAYANEGWESVNRTPDQTKAVIQNVWKEKAEYLNTNPAKLDEKVFKESISQGKMPDIFEDSVYLKTIETPVAFTEDSTNHIFDLEALNDLKKQAYESNIKLLHPLTRQPLDFSKLVYLPNVKQQIEEAKEKVKE